MLSFNESWIWGTAGETYEEELASAATHAIGVLMSLLALVTLVQVAHATRAQIRYSYGLVVYGLSLVILYSCSTLYHLACALYPDENQLYIFRQLDHIGIFFLIAGTYTPLVLNVLVHDRQTSYIRLRGSILLGFVWLCAVVGTVQKLLVPIDAAPLWVHAAMYVLMGFGLVVAYGPVTRHTPAAVLAWIALGGAFYIGGLAWFLSDAVNFNHALWHCCVIAGSVAHYVGVLASALPTQSMPLTHLKVV